MKSFLMFREIVYMIAKTAKCTVFLLLYCLFIGIFSLHHFDYKRHIGHSSSLIAKRVPNGYILGMLSFEVIESKDKAARLL